MDYFVIFKRALVQKLAALSPNEYTVRVLHAKRTHISTDVIEFGDEGMLDDIHCNL